MCKKSVKRFLEAQKRSYDVALSEIRKGEKISCWMWYIFPQVEGLGKSEISSFYAIKSGREIKDYLRCPVLRCRYEKLVEVLLEFRRDHKTLCAFGPVDAMKLRSSLTLFYLASCCAGYKRLWRLCGNALDVYFGGELCFETVKWWEAVPNEC